MAASRRLWTEDEVALLYWALPLMRALAKMTNREFAAIAMKLANLLAVATDNRQGLANASAMDRAVVRKYGTDPAGLESRIVQMFNAGGVDAASSTDELQAMAVETLRRHKVALHSDVIALLLVADNPATIVPKATLVEVLRSAPSIVEKDAKVFLWVPGEHE